MIFSKRQNYRVIVVIDVVRDSHRETRGEFFGVMGLLCI